MDFVKRNSVVREEFDNQAKFLELDHVYGKNSDYKNHHPPRPAKIRGSKPGIVQFSGHVLCIQTMKDMLCTPTT